MQGSVGTATAGSVQAEVRMDGLRQVGFLETQGTELGPWVAWGASGDPEVGLSGEPAHCWQMQWPPLATAY